MITKLDRIKEYNQNNPGYNITATKRMTEQDLAWYEKWGARSLDDLYKNPSDAKRSSYNAILRDYKPRRIIGVQGSCHTYSVVLEAANGDILHITARNNYLVTVK